MDDFIAFHAHQANRDMIKNAGGEHSILFLLKRLDLDIKKGYTLETVFAYGYEKHLISEKNQVLLLVGEAMRKSLPDRL